MARHEARSVGADLPNFHMLSAILLRVVGITGPQLINLLQPMGGRMPANQQQFDLLFNQLRCMGHILERSASNIGSALHPQHSRPSHAFTTETYHVSGYQQVQT
eukprot:10669978-Lingulodinium_polyedra.AAC.1